MKKRVNVRKHWKRTFYKNKHLGGINYDKRINRNER